MPIIQSIDRALQILDLFDEQTSELKITDISLRMNLHKSTVHSILKTLKQHGYIDQDEETGKYRLGMKLVEKGQMLLHGMDLRRIVRPHLQALSEATGQTTHLVILDGSDGVYIDKVEGVKAAIRYSQIGRRVSLHSSACGKTLAAHRTDNERTLLMKGYTFFKRTDRTIVDPVLFKQELETVMDEGIAYDREENEPGVRCVAAPIFDHTGKITAAMSISTMVTYVNDEDLAELANLLKREAALISIELGWRI